MTVEVRGRPGAAIKAIRRRLDLTLAQVSQATGIPVSTLSRIENDQACPTYDHLVRLSEGLHVDISALFTAIRGAPQLAAGARRSINRLGEGLVIDAQHHLLRYLSTDLTDKQFTPILAEVTAASLQEHGPLLHHPGEEFVFVVRGTLELHTEIYSPAVLQAGESMYFDSSTGHAYIRHGQAPCTVLSICTAPHPY
jgi:transcriptional regulator with XRE-family HTH domain